MTGSFGVAALDARLDLTAALQAADSALYAAKARGRNSVCLETDLMLEEA